MNQNNGLSKGVKIVIISILSFLVFVLSILSVLLVLTPNTFIEPEEVDNTRTIMIYMAGTDLESNHGNASADLKGIKEYYNDPENYHILLYTGGTKIWHNSYISPQENSIYELTMNGFEKKETLTKKSMGLEDTLTEFLDYGYRNYEAGNYDLIMWDHGLGSLGSIYDENTKDFITLSEFTAALQKSPFNGEKKLQNIIFSTCLNATLEVATILSPYANYLVASEEPTWSNPYTSELSFLNYLNDYETSVDVGIGFIEEYKQKLVEMNMFNNPISTYSIIDLNQIPELNKKMSSLYNEIDVKKEFSSLSRTRSNLYQFGVAADNINIYDTVDLFEFVSELSYIDSKKTADILKFIKDKVVIYNWDNTTHGNGISTYIPYNGDAASINYHMNILEKADLNEEYFTFITNFNNLKKSSTASFSEGLEKNEVKTTSKDNNVKMKLTDEQQKTFARGSYIIFEKKEDGLFMPLYAANDAKLDKKGYLSTNLNDNLIAIVDENLGTKTFFMVNKIESKEKKTKRYTAQVVLNKVDEDGWPVMDNGVMHITVDKKNNITVDKVLLTTKNEDGMSVTGGAADLDDYTAIDFSNLRYNILDENGNYTTGWESSGTIYMEEVKIDKYHFELASLDDGYYYCVFVVYDIYNRPSYSNLIEIK